jgi:phage baseplate assembly protein W
MSGLSPKLPLATDSEDGYALNKTYRDLVRQNLKMLILTNPGERMMDPLFGVGLRMFLFEQNASATYERIAGAIESQVTRYMPFLEIENIHFLSPDQDASLDRNFVGITVTYKIIPLGTSDLLDINA